MPRNAPRPRAYLAIAVVVIVLAATGLLGKAFAAFGAGVRTVAAPLAALAGKIRGADHASQEDLGVVRAQLDAARTENAKLSELRAENEELKAALDYRKKTNEATIAARVVARTGDDVFHGIVIDKGSEDGVHAGQPVIAGDGVIVGKTYAVKDRTSSVMLLTDGKSRLAVTVNAAEGTVGVLEGERGISARITLVPASSKMAPGDTVVTSGLEAGIRRGLLVGTVDQVTKNSQDPFQSATILPFDAAVNPSFVQVIAGE